MKMHPVFTRIPKQSFDAYVNPEKIQLDAVMAALAVDPHEAEDAFKELGVVGTPHRLAYFASLGVESRGAYTAALQTLSQWMTSTPMPMVALDSLVEYNDLLGTWCVLRVVTDMFKTMSIDDELAISTLQTLDRWVRNPKDRLFVRHGMGEAPLRVAEAQTNLAAEAEDFYSPRNRAYTALHLLAMFVADRHHDGSPMLGQEAVNTVNTAANALILWSGNDPSKVSRASANKTWAKRMEQLRIVMADACLSYPGTP